MDDKRVYFTELLARQKKSSKSIESFCKENNVSSGQFYYWRQKIKNASPEKGIFLVPLTINNNIDAFCEVIYPNGVTLRLEQSLSREELITFITLLD